MIVAPGLTARAEFFGYVGAGSMGQDDATMKTQAIGMGSERGVRRDH